MIRISVVGLGVAWNSAPGAMQPVVEQVGREPLGVDADVDPAEQAARRGGEAAAVGFGQPDGARARRLELRHHALCVAAQQALLEAVRQRLLGQARRGQRRQQLGVDEAVDQPGRRGEEADPPVRHQDLREAGDVDRALERVERRQARQVRRREVRIGVVLDDVQVVRLRELQHAVRRRSESDAPVGLCSTETVT